MRLLNLPLRLILFIATVTRLIIVTFSCDRALAVIRQKNDQGLIHQNFSVLRMFGLKELN